ncbi:MAG: flagellar basal body-associated FliL family protein [Lachnospiraceae bacterium]|nr:flagellar basal body-associated FliL family protein [Candidatus Colinaster equi]
MKKNMISILILALLVVNVALTAIMMFSCMGTLKKTAKLIDGITSALSLEVADPAAVSAEAEAEAVAMEDIEVYKIEDQLTISLAKGADGEPHYCLVSVSLSINTKDEDYAKYQPTLADKEDLIKSAIFEVIQSYPIEEAESNPDMLREKILEKIQEMYNSKFIFNVVFRDIMFS